MVKKVIQVPMDGDLLDRLDCLSKKRQRPRAELIRDACRAFLRKTEIEEMDRVYQEGYEKYPEDPDAGMPAALMMAEILEEEPW